MKLMKMAMLATTAMLAAGAALAESKVKVGMITTLSGGGAGLGIDARDGFMLALKLSGSDAVEVVIEDDQQKPEIAVQLADKMIQSAGRSIASSVARSTEKVSSRLICLFSRRGSTAEPSSPRALRSSHSAALGPR